MRTIGSQNRETLDEAGAKFVSITGEAPHRELIVDEDGSKKLYGENDHFAGYVLVHEGVGFEFVRSINEA